MTVEEQPTGSPNWSSTTKLVVGLTFIAMVAALLVNFRGIIGPLILAFILAYALHPLADRITQGIGLSWTTSVNVVFLFLVALVVTVFTVTGLAVAQQLQSLIRFVQTIVTELPTFVEDLSTQVYVIGPFRLDFAQFDLEAVVNQLLAVVQPLLGQLGNLVRTFATGAVGVLGWGFFILLIAYFVLADSGRWFPNILASVEIPGHQVDIRRLGRELGRIWNAFLRGQIGLFLLTVIAVAALMTVLGVRLALGLSLLAGLARFVPYLGPLTVWIVTGLVAFFQESNYLGLPPLQYALVVVIVQLVIDQVFDNYLSPRIMGQTLGVHPAAVLVSAIIATNLIGLVGLLLAAPVLATFLLFGRYAMRKMLDLDPWPEPEAPPRTGTLNMRSLLANLGKIMSRLRKKGVEDGE
jgi:predicted PurR-regulated permease PerM